VTHRYRGFVARWARGAALLLAVLFPWQKLRAISVEELAADRHWRLASLEIEGNERFSDRELRAIMETRARPWYALWRRPPLFEPRLFAGDLERLERRYRARGYYEARVRHDLQVDHKRGLVAAKIEIAEGAPVRVEKVAIEVRDAPSLQPELEALRPELPLREGEIFETEAYAQTAARVRAFLRDRARAHAEVERRAEVVLERAAARAFYTVRAGPPTVFGATEIAGLEDVESEVVVRELAYRRGEPFSSRALAETRRKLVELDLFREVEVRPRPAPADATVVPIEIRLEEKPPREVAVGIGYGTEDQLRAQLRWRHNNWLGSARRLEIRGKVSFIERELIARFAQPHFLARDQRLTVSFGPRQLDEPGYVLNGTRFEPRLERNFSAQWLGFVGYRLEYDHLGSVSGASLAALAPQRRSGWLSAPSIGLLWNTTDDPFSPTRGGRAAFQVESAGGPWGGAFDFFKLESEGRVYRELRAGTVLAARLRLGFGEPFGRSEELPLFERFYAGGSNSVRGFGRRRLGPRSPADDPIGGRSVLEGSLEMRQRVAEELGGVIFLDFGSVSLRSFDPRLGGLEWAAGFGGRYATPLGPVRLDVGFPFRRPKNDRGWQIHLSVGQAF
jgi:outer membrane protein insertion porin family